jgi:DNA-binding PadR family transcriptional regulator
MPSINVLDITSKEEALLRTVLHKPLYGAEIAKTITLASNGDIIYECESLYPVLARLVAKGLLSVKWKTELEGDEKKYKKKCYTITDLGKELIERKQIFLTKISTN